MRLSSANNQFLFQFPTDFIAIEVDERLKKYMDKNWIPYTDTVSYLNSTLKEIVFPSITYEDSEQIIKYGKKRNGKNLIIIDKLKNVPDI